jgi:hypothetical protein
MPWCGKQDPPIPAVTVLLPVRIQKAVGPKQQQAVARVNPTGANYTPDHFVKYIIFKRIAEDFDVRPPRGKASHREFLDLMGQPGKARPALVSEGIVERLDTYPDHFCPGGC